MVKPAVVMNSKSQHKLISGLKINSRNVKSPYKKWTDDEQYKILNFLKNNKPIEKPTAQIYYRRFMAEHGIYWDWTLNRCKVRNMRNTYFKLKFWADSQKSELKSQSELDHFQESLLKKCPLYYEYEQVFGETLPDPHYSNSTNNTMPTWDTADESTSDKEVLVNSELDPSVKIELTTSDSASYKEDPINETETLDSNTSTAMSTLNQMLSLLIEVKREKLKTDLDFKIKEFQLQKERFEFEKEKHYENLRLKEKEIETNDKIKIMELKTKETIALRELEMKERIELAKIKGVYQKQNNDKLV